MPPKLSIVLLAKAETDSLNQALRSAGFADEIVILLDSAGSPQTAAIARQYSQKVFQHKLENFARQKNLLLSKASGEWVFLLDADETIPVALAKEIKKVIASAPEEVAFALPRRNIIFGAWIKHTGWYPDYQTRLFRKGKVKYYGEVHEQLKVNGALRRLKNALVHHNYQSVGQFLAKQRFYAQLEARRSYRRGRRFSLIYLIGKPLKEFSSRYFQSQGYLDGWRGLELSLLMAYYRALVAFQIRKIERHGSQ